MKLTVQEKVEDENRRKELWQERKEYKEFEKTIYASKNSNIKFSLAGWIFGAMFAFIFVCAIGIITARLVGYSKIDYRQIEQQFNGVDYYGNK